MESLIKEMQEPETGVPVRIQKLFLSYIPAAFMGKFSRRKEKKSFIFLRGKVYSFFRSLTSRHLGTSYSYSTGGVLLVQAIISLLKILSL